MTKPIVSYYRGNDPTRNIKVWLPQLTEINIIRTKVLTDEFIDVCIENKEKLFLHVVVNGMGGSPFEKNIPTVKWTFAMLNKLVSKGFPIKKILLIVDPIIPNENGLKALEILLKVFTEFRELKLRYLKLNILSYRNVGTVGSKEPINEHIIKTSSSRYNVNSDKYVISNTNIIKRPEIKPFFKFLYKNDIFFKEYYKILTRYKSIINVDSGDEALIGIRELLTFGFSNNWRNDDGSNEKIVEYKEGHKQKPIVTYLGNGNPVRCPNRCLLCPFKQ